MNVRRSEDQVLLDSSMHDSIIEQAKPFCLMKMEEIHRSNVNEFLSHVNSLYREHTVTQMLRHFIMSAELRSSANSGRQEILLVDVSDCTKIDVGRIPIFTSGEFFTFLHALIAHNGTCILRTDGQPNALYVGDYGNKTLIIVFFLKNVGWVYDAPRPEYRLRRGARIFFPKQ